jgi:hypothetical protein
VIALQGLGHSPLRAVARYGSARGPVAALGVHVCVLLMVAVVGDPAVVPCS